jgi:hypothetical protein
MSDWGNGSVVFLIPIVAIIGGITSAIVATVMRARVRELEIKERIAMIEKGLVPPPEVDPHGFDRAMNRYDRMTALQGRISRGGARHRRAGITLLGIGFGLMFLIGIAGQEPQAGIGVGGFLVILGLAFFLNSFFESRQEPPPSPNGGSTTGPRPSDSMPPS